jgi:ABC-type transport system involved in multi-copper enzyme maturation permease subunit
MWTKLWAIAGNAFTETVRQPVYGLILLATAGLLLCCMLFAGFTLDNDTKLLKEFGLSTLLMAGLFLASFSAAGILSREIENKTVMSVVSKPVGRAAFLLGKFIGLIAALTLAFYLSTLALLMLARHGVLEAATDPYDVPVIVAGFSAVILAVLLATFCNYFYGLQFGPTAIFLCLITMTLAGVFCCLIDKNWKLEESFGKDLLDPHLLAGAFMVYLVVVFMTAVALAASTRAGQVATLFTCLVVLMLGMTSDYMFGEAAQHAGEAPFSAAAYSLIPNLGVFWIAEAVSDMRAISGQYLLASTAYAALYTLAALMIAFALFHNREVG